MILTTDSYDPAEERPRASHITKKDLRVLAVVLVVIAVLLYPIYKAMLGQSEKHLCKQNFKGISNAITLYAMSNDDKLPPAYVAPDGVSPLLDSKGRPFTWVSLVSEYMSGRSNFECRSASSAENTVHQHQTDSSKSITCSYGYYLPRAGASTYAFRDISQAVLVTETSNRGSNDTFDPIPLLDINGQPAPDAYVVGFDDSNTGPTNKSASVTRLAFKGTSGGIFSPTGPTRHEGGNFFLFADGHAATHGPGNAKLRRLGAQIEGFWATR